MNFFLTTLQNKTNKEMTLSEYKIAYFRAFHREVSSTQIFDIYATVKYIKDIGIKYSKKVEVETVFFIKEENE